MNALASLLLASTLAQAEPLPQLPKGPFINEYRIEATLDDATMTILGRAEITFRNPAQRPIARIPFHLYPNAWANTRTRWIEDARAADDVLERGREHGGYLHVLAVRDASSGADLGPRTDLDETRMEVELPAPLPPGGEFRFDVEWRTKLPRVVARMGRFGDHVDAMQWFPKIAGFAGDRFVDWHFREPSEFFANFGRYEVKLTLPARYVVEATGVPTLSSTDESAGTRTVTFVAQAVHDFAWTADPEFERHVAISRDGVEIVLLNQPFLARKAQLTLDVTRFTIDTYADWFFPYPYPRVVIDALPAGLDGGMEYPMLFTISHDAPEALDWLVERSEEPAGVTVHEFGHQYWYGIVATNEFEEAWLDEGITTYLTYKVLDLFFGEGGERRGLPLLAATTVYEPLLSSGSWLGAAVGYDESPFHDGRRRSLFGFRLPSLALEGAFPERFHRRMASYAPFADVSPLRTFSWEGYRAGDRGAYRSIAYSKPTLMLRTLENLAGWEAVRNLIATWARRHAFAHPTTEDFLAVGDEVLEPAHAAFLRAAVDGSDTVDWAVEEARSTRVGPPQGFLLPARPGEPIREVFPDSPATPSWRDRFAALSAWYRGRPAAAAPDEDEDGADVLHRAEVVIRNHGRLAVPVEVELRYADGSTERVHLAGDEPWYRVTPQPRAARLVAAIADPDRRIALDLDLTNNGLLAVEDRASARLLGSFEQFWMQCFLSGVAWFA